MRNVTTASRCAGLDQSSARGITRIPFWHEQLQMGHRLTAIGGSDAHGVTSQNVSPPPVVYAKELSIAAIMAGIRDGKTTRHTAIPTAKHSWSFEETSHDKRHWICIDVRYADGKLALLGNPIYLN